MKFYSILMCDIECMTDLVSFYFIDRGQETFSVYGLLVHRLGFAGPVVSVTTTQLCHYSLTLAIDNM